MSTTLDNPLSFIQSVHIYWATSMPHELCRGATVNGTGRWWTSQGNPSSRGLGHLAINCLILILIKAVKSTTGENTGYQGRIPWGNGVWTSSKGIKERRKMGNGTWEGRRLGVERSMVHDRNWDTVNEAKAETAQGKVAWGEVDGMGAPCSWFHSCFWNH